MILAAATGLGSWIGRGPYAGRVPERCVLAASALAWTCLLWAPDGFVMTGFCGDTEEAAIFAAAWRSMSLPAGMATEMRMHVLMVFAAMLPLVVGPIRFVALRSFRRRRFRAIVALLCGYVSAWLLAEMCLSLVSLASGAAGGGGPAMAAAAHAAAAAWQLAPWKRQALRACHRTSPLHPTGVRADLSCLRYGAGVGAACVAACGPMMLAVMLSPMPRAALAGMFAVALYERYAEAPSACGAGTATALLAFAALVTAVSTWPSPGG